MTAPRPFGEVVEELTRLDAAATPGPWALNNNGVQNMTDVCADGLVANIARWKDGKPDPDNTNDANAALIAAMRNALPALLARAAVFEAAVELIAQNPHGDGDVTYSSEMETLRAKVARALAAENQPRAERGEETK